MTVSVINKWFARFAVWQIKHRALLLVVLAVFTVFCMAGLRNMKLEVYDNRTDEDREANSLFKETFNTEDSIMVLVTADDVFAPQVLEVIGRVGKRLEEEVPYANKLNSLLTIKVPVGSENEITIGNPYDENLADSFAAYPDWESKKKFFMGRQSLVNTLFSSDAKETWIQLTLSVYEGGANFARDAITPVARKIIQEEAEQCKDICKLMPTGWSYSFMEATEATMQESKLRMSLGFLAMLICLFAFVRSPIGVLISTLCTIAGIASIIGFTSWLKIPVDLNCISLPVLLGMALSVGYSIHFINAFRLQFRKTGKRYESVLLCVEETGWPILFTNITTVVAFISFLFFDIESVRWTGGVSAGISFIVYLYTFIIIPICLSIGKDAKVAPEKYTDGATSADLKFESFGHIIIRKSKFIVVLSAFLVAGIIPGLCSIEVNTDFLAMQGDKIPHVARTLELLKHTLGSVYSYDVLVSVENDDKYFEDPKNMLALEEFGKYLGGLSMTKISDGTPRVQSGCGMLKEINRMYNNDNPDAYVINTTPGFIAENLVMWEEDFADWFDIDSENFGLARLHVDVSNYDANRILQDISSAQAKAAELFPGAKVSFVGEMVDYVRMNKKLFAVMMESLSFSILLIALLLVIVFTSIRVGLIAMIPNIAPVLIVGALMGYANFPLDALTVVVMPMILGIAVDDTIHFSNHIKYWYEKSGDYALAVINSFREIGKTMCMTTVIICAMFLVTVFSPMKYMSHIGLLVIVGLSSALIADYTLTPALLYLIKPFGKQKTVNTKADSTEAANFYGGRIMKKLLSVTASIFFATSLFAQSLTGYDIAKHANEIDTSKSASYTSVMTLKSKKGATKVREILTKSKEFADSRKSLVVFQSPEEVSGVAYLTFNYNNKGKDTDSWLYTPSMKKVRRINGSSRQDAFMGSDFTYEDMDGRGIDRDDFNLLGEENVDGVDCWKVEAIAKNSKEKNPRKVIWFRKDNYIAVKSEFYNKNNELTRKMSVSKISQIDGIWTAGSIYIETTATGHSTLMELKDVHYNTDIDDKIFTVTSMERGIQR